jgi:hypothetical protein
MLIRMDLFLSEILNRIQRRGYKGSYFNSIHHKTLCRMHTLHGFHWDLSLCCQSSFLVIRNVRKAHDP